MYSFNYHRPHSVDEALGLLRGNKEARLLAGGMTLLPAMKLRLARPSDLVDLATVAALTGIRVSRSAVEIGAMVRHADIAGNEEVRAVLPALAALAGKIGDPQVRHRGTLGGSLANSDPAADYPAAVLAFDAVVKTDRREIAADDFFLGLFETALEADEILQSVRFAVPRRAAYAKFPNPASRYAIVGVMVAELDRGVRVAVTGAGPCAFRATAFEEALTGNFSASRLEGLRVDAELLNSDLHASPEYRAHLVQVMAKRAVVAAGG
jgi:carbon-monoxide dehydrogenase medium subunit